MEVRSCYFSLSFLLAFFGRATKQPCKEQTTTTPSLYIFISSNTEVLGRLSSIMAPLHSCSCWPCLLFLACFLCACPIGFSNEPEMGSTRVVFQTKYGDIEFGFYSEVAPKTVEHIMNLVQLGAYNSNHFFRVDKGFVAQVADVVAGREVPLNAEQLEEGQKTVIGEFSDVKHVKGILSMGRYEDPDSGSSSFSILLGSASHLDGKYAIFGKVTKGYDTLEKLENLPTRQEGIFVMPLERISIISTYYYDTKSRQRNLSCEDEVSMLRRRLIQSANAIEKQRSRCLP
eukprot:c29676_g1_i1 orf=83-943(+)